MTSGRRRSSLSCLRAEPTHLKAVLGVAASPDRGRFRGRSWEVQALKRFRGETAGLLVTARLLQGIGRVGKFWCAWRSTLYRWATS